MNLREKIWGKKLPSEEYTEEYTKKSSWFSRFRDPLFWAGSVFTGGLIVVGVLTGLIIPFAVLAGVLGLLEVTGVLGQVWEKFKNPEGTGLFFSQRFNAHVYQNSLEIN